MAIITAKAQLEDKFFKTTYTFSQYYKQTHFQLG